MPAITLDIKVDSSGFLAEVDKAIADASKRKVTISKFELNRQDFINQVKSLGGGDGIKINVSPNKSFFSREVNALLKGFIPSNKLKINVDEKYLQKQIDAAIKGVGKTSSAAQKEIQSLTSKLPATEKESPLFDVKANYSEYNALVKTINEVNSSLAKKPNTAAANAYGEISTKLADLKVQAESAKITIADFKREMDAIKKIDIPMAKDLAKQPALFDANVNTKEYAKLLQLQSDASALSKQFEGTQAGAGYKSVLADISALQERASSAQLTVKEFNAELQRIQTGFNGIKTPTIFEPGTKEHADALAKAYSKVKSIQEDLSHAKSGKGTPMYDGLVEQEQAAKNLVASLEAGKISKQDFDSQMSQITAGQAKFSQQLKDGGYWSNTFSEKLDRFKRHVTTIMSLARAFQMLSRVIKPIVNAVIEVDSALTQLQIVTNASNTEMEKYAANIMNIADKTAGSVTDITNSTTTFARLGYRGEVPTQLAEYTQMLQNVGDIDESSATSAITAIIKAYDVGADKLETVMDKLVTTGNNFPISVAELAEGMNNAGSMLAMATGKDLEQSLALLTAANTTTQNISKSSTGLRTIVARIRNVKTELDDLGETMTDAQYNDIVKALTDNGVALTDQTGNLRNTYDVLLDLSEAWKDMNESEQAALAKTLSGTRQQNVFASLMNNFEEASGAMQKMLNSEGALTDANDIYMDSAKAHIQQLKNAFVEFSQSAISTKAIKSVVDFAKSFLKIASGVLKVVSSIGGLKTVLPIVLSLVAIFKGESIVKSITKAGQAITRFANIGKASFSALGKSAKGFGTVMTSMAKESVSAAEMVNAAMGVIGIAMTVASLVVAGIQAIIDANAQATKAQIDEANEAHSAIENIKTAYDEYNNVAKSGSSSTEELSAATENLCKALGVTKAEFNGAVQEAGSYDAAIQKLIESSMQLKLIEEEEGLDAAYSKLYDFRSAYNRAWEQLVIDTQNKGDGPGKAQTRAHSFLKNVVGIDPDEIDDAKDWLGKMDEIGQKVVQLYNDPKYGENSKEFKALDNFYKNMKADLSEYETLLKQFSTDSVALQFSKLGDVAVETESEFNKYRDSLIAATLATGDFEGVEQYAIAAVDELLSTTKGFESFYTAAEKAALATSTVAKGLQGIKEVEAGTSGTRSVLDEILGGEDYDTGMKKRVEYYQKLLEQVQQENWGGKHYEALADYFGIDITQSVDAQIAQIEKLKSYYSDVDQGMYNFLSDISANKEALQDIATFDEDSGLLWWDSSKLQEFADAMQIPKDALIDFLDLYIQHTPPAEYLKLPPEEAASWLEADGILEKFGDNLVLNRQKFDELAEAAGVDSDELLSQIRELEEYSDVQIFDLDIDTSSAEAAANNIRAFFADTASYGYDASQQLQAVAASLSTLDAETVKSILIQLDLPQDTLGELLSYLPEDLRSQISIDDTQATDAVQTVTLELEELGVQIDGIDGSTITITVTDNGTSDALYQKLQNIIALANYNGVSVNSSGKGYTHSRGGRMMENASGTKHSASGLSLLGDEYSASGRPKPELVVSRGNAYLAGVNGPTVRKLNAGDIVYTYRETKKILGNNLDKLDGIPAFASGTASRYWNKISGGAGSYSSSAAYSSYYGTSAGSGSSGSSATNSGDGENWFEQQYELHNHYRKLDKETDQNYLTWLTGAWKKAYAEGVIDLKEAHKYEEEAYELMKKIAADRFNEEYKTHQHNVAMGQETDQEYYSWLEWRHQVAYANNEITLEEYWKYQEEVYKKAKELVNDYFNDIDKKIDMLENAGKTDKEIISWDEAGMAYVEEQITKLKKEGKDNNDSTVQDLQKTWWGYYNDRKKREEDITKNAKSAAKELVDYRMKMLKKDLDTEKDNLNTRLKNLQDFYSKQKDMLQDSYDEDKYLDEQAEKRKAVTDLEIQLAQIEYDNSAWAQKKRLELSQQLVEAQKALADFEKDHALEVAKEKLDAIQQLQEDELNAQIDAIEKTSKSEAEIYQQALKDVQKGGQGLYEAMVEYNNWEGTGNPEDISEMWDEAYTSLKKYREQFGEYYKDIQLTYGTDTTPAVVDTSKIDAGLNPVKPVLETKQPAPAPAPAPKPAAKADPVQGSAVQLKSGAKLATNSYATPSLNAASWTIGRTLYVQAYYPGRAAPYHIGTTKNINDGASTWVGWVNKSQFVGYASGTRNALAGIHEINERGDEALFKTSDGSSYRLFSGGEKVFNSKATDFLYDFANNPEAVLASVLGAVGSGIGSEIKNNTVSQNISLGDIIIQGNATEKTISEIRREKRSEMDYMLRELNRLNK